MHRSSSKVNRLRFIGMIFCIIAAGCIALLFVAYLTVRVPMGANPAGARLQRIERSKNYHDGKFVNDIQTHLMEPGTFWKMIRLYFGKQVRRPKAPIRVVSLARESFREPLASGLRVIWMGHSTALIEMDGYVILMDPVFSERASFAAWIGPKRFHPAPITIPELPEIDAVIISHDHYDHLDYKSIKQLIPKTRAFYTPLGVGTDLEMWGVPSEKIIELDWWEEVSIGDNFLFVATPARHFSGRGLFGGNKTLWASWVLIGPEHRVYFSGDTGMLPVFEDIGKRFGPFDVTFIEIGAYSETWPYIHSIPEEAVKVHQMVQGKILIPIHWGTFNLSYHGWTEPIERLLVAARVEGTIVAVPRPGEFVTPNVLAPMTHWWSEAP
jgi:L-ascorbate metabolism protein UlaG (beta-lactamase superfamily)